MSSSFMLPASRLDDVLRFGEVVVAIVTYAVVCCDVAAAFGALTAERKAHCCEFGIFADVAPLPVHRRRARVVVLQELERRIVGLGNRDRDAGVVAETPLLGDRKSTRLNSSHDQISDAVFC